MTLSARTVVDESCPKQVFKQLGFVVSVSGYYVFWFKQSLSQPGKVLEDTATCLINWTYCHFGSSLLQIRMWTPELFSTFLLEIVQFSVESSSLAKGGKIMDGQISEFVSQAIFRICFVVSMAQQEMVEYGCVQKTSQASVAKALVSFFLESEPIYIPLSIRTGVHCFFGSGKR
jgi:uncharacterized membrane protein YagU involved in acid resistance